MAAAPAEPAATEQAPAEDLAAAPADQPAPVTGEEPAQDMAAAPAEAAPATEQPATEDMAAVPADQPATSTEETTTADASQAPAESTTVPAEEEVAADTSAAPAPAAASEGFLAFAADQIQASDLIGKSVYSGEDSIGEISDLILQKEGETRAALIDVGGFLGVGEKTVAIPFDVLQITKAEDGSEQVTVAMSKEELEQLPAIELPADTAAVQEPVAPDATAPAGQEPTTTGSVAQPATNYEAITQEIAASELMGATVYGPDESSVGEISDVVFNKTGDIEAAVIDVGGFLGIGEKPVAVGFDELQVRKDENGTLTVMVSATQEQLEGAPAYEEVAETAPTVQ